MGFGPNPSPTEQEVADFFFIDTIPSVLKYWNEPKNNTYDWRGVAPRETYIANILKDLNAALKQSKATWKIVVGHHAIRSVSEHDDTQELVQQLLRPILKANGVDLYINGHDHCLEHISSRDRHWLVVPSTSVTASTISSG
ncbi:purple acid phosphatase 8 [Setaria viridis]|uniref:purple acid phosphatase 8 n=1 Tax=Setaria viridis TaxID=4556 RepID=UPI0014939797|nr:purple acid phosphatase 8-like [Setaria viridis]